MEVRIEESWKSALAQEFEAPYFKRIVTTVREEYRHYTIYPKGEDIFRAFDLCPFDEVKVVILGQDPYHGPGQAQGLSFSVPKECPLPPSLQNIYAELKNDLELEETRQTGDLTAWARQGVLLLNSTLTVRAHQAFSHSAIEWHTFTDRVIALLSEHHEHVVFILWGASAKTKIPLIDATKHTIISSPHPSPLAAYRGFFGSRPFSKTNYALITHRQSPIEWMREE